MTNGAPMENLQLMLIVGALAVAGVGGLLYALFSDFFASEARRGKRVAALKPISQEQHAAARKANLQAGAQREVGARVKQLSDNKKAHQKLESRLVQAGLTISPGGFQAIFYVLALIVAGGLLLSGQSGLIAAAMGVVVALGLPRFVLNKLVARRQRKFLENMANAIDILVRGVRSGLPVSEGLKVIANEIPDPVRTEFRLLIDSVAVGVSLEDALGKMYDRVPLPEVNFFRTVLAIQKSTGGNLAEALSNLSGILRDRKKLKGKISALSSEARMSAIIIGSLPFIVGVMVYMMSPDYMLLLFTHATGQMLLGGGLVWMSFGVMMMRSMIKFDM